MGWWLFALVAFWSWWAGFMMGGSDFWHKIKNVPVGQLIERMTSDR